MNNKNYVNYHTHKYYTNKTIHDSPTGYEEYINRAIELGQTVITSVEHGYQGNYFKLNEMILEKNIEFQKRRDKGEINVPKDLKFVFGAEIYWVKDRHPKTIIDEDGKEKTINDKANCHMILLAKTENARKKINLLLSQASEDGYYNNRPRMDFELLFKLPKDEVFVTTACLQYWNKYEDIDEITLKFKEYFGDNFFLEVQTHNTDKQKKLNKHIIEMSEKYNIPIIAGMDSHFIYPSDEEKRENIMKYKSSAEDDEIGWYTDYPDYDTVVKRFKEQGILTDKQIEIALENTNLILDFDNLDLGMRTITRVNDKGEKEYELYSEIKLPTIYPNLNQEQKDELLRDILNKEWKQYKKDEGITDKEDIKQHIEGIRYEFGEIKKTKMADYFLLHYKALKRGVDMYGGKITKRGRGSAVGYFTNTLLGFSKVDRFKAPIKIYPERFMTSDRILKARTCPDIDNNVATQPPFVKAFRDLLGEHEVYPFIAFGTIAKSKAIKMYMSINGEEPSVQDAVSKQLKEYDKAISHCETDEEKEEINIEDYLEEQYIHYIEDSKDYQGIVDNGHAHPCGHLLLNRDIREEIGIVRCESANSKTSVLVACVDGATAEHYKYLKTDLLIVDVVGLTEAIWERIGEKSISNTELERRLACDEGNKAWDIYANGYTMCVNQCEKEGTKHNCMRYKMKNTAELSAFVAGVRPGFRSLFNNFLDRKPYTTHVPELDEVLKDSYSYMLYQESIMAFLNWLGIDMKETYGIVKKISKKIYIKHPEQMEELKNKVYPQWIKNTGSEKYFNETFQVVNDAGSYAFNSAHSYCVGNDGAEIAYLKAYYPYETYETCLNWYMKKNNKDKITALKEEMLKAFGIKEGKIKWGLDNRKFTLDKKNKCINPCLSSFKGIGKNVPEELYKLSQEKQYDNFIDLIKDIKNTSVDSGMLDKLIKLDYFSEFGNPNQLLKYVELYNQWYNRKTLRKDKLLEYNVTEEYMRKYANETEKQFNKIDSTAILKDLFSKVNEKTSVYDRLKYQHEICGYCYSKYPKYKGYGLVLDVNTRYSPVITVYLIDVGKEVKYKVYKNRY